MKKSIYLLLLLVFAFCISTSLYAQDDREKPVKVIIMRPPPHRLNQADLWNITIINSGQSVSAYLFGSMTNNENGELIATGQTMTFEVKKGTTNFKVSDLPKVPDVNYVSKDPKYKTSFMNTGGAPPGDYKICVELRYTNNSVAGEDCIEQKVIGGDAPQLISPRDEEEINNDNPIFTWMHMKAPGSDQTYTLRIVELKGDESPENAMLKNKAFFEKEGITQQMLQYPSSAPKFEEGKKYAWQIYVVQSDAIITKSEANLFTNKNIVTKTPPVTLTSGTNDCVNNNFSFFDDYSDDDPWMPIAKGNVIGTGPYDIAGCNPRNSSISSSSFVKVNGGQCKFQNVTEEGNDYRTFRKFTGDFKTNFETSTCWEAKFEFTFSQLGVDNRVGHPIFALTADSPEPGGPWNPINYSDASTSPQSAFCNFSDQDAMMVWLWLPTTAYYNNYNIVHPDQPLTAPPVGTRKAAFFPWCKNGKNLDGYIPTTLPIDAEANTPYYIKLERINATSGRINVYSDPGFTNHVTNSPQCFPIPNGEEITGLNTLQHSNAPDGVGRELTGALDNTCIKKFPEGTLTCGTTLPPSNCNSDCKLITGNVSVCQNTTTNLKAYVGKEFGNLIPSFMNSSPNYSAWPSSPNTAISPYITPLNGKRYVIKATGGYPDQWGRVYDAAFQIKGTWGSGVCQGNSQYMLTGNNFNAGTRPSFPLNYNFNFHEYFYEFASNGSTIGYRNINGVQGGDGHIQANNIFYELCDTNNYKVEWNPVSGNEDGAVLNFNNTLFPTFTSSLPGTFKYEVKLFCKADNSFVDRDTVIIYVPINDCSTPSFRPPDCGCGLWNNVTVSINSAASVLVDHEGILNVANGSSLSITPSYSFTPENCSNSLHCWIYSGVTPSWSNIWSQEIVNNSPFSFNPPGIGTYIIRINPQIGTGSSAFSCPERNFVVIVN